ncbi:MAG TPA: HEAT repeat domain-containing protein [Planctomycetota bacterium]|nr:HEAT repeat domain-containing protein [Planctomycetota bacterium]
MNTSRACAIVMLGCAAVLVRDDRGADGAGPGTFRSALLAREPAGQLTPEAVREALVGAGREGLALGFELLDDPEAPVRAGAASYLGGRRSRLAVPHLIKLLRDPDPTARRAAAQALGAIGDPQALPFLERAMGEGEPLVAEAAVGAAREIRSAGTARPKPKSPFR